VVVGAGTAAIATGVVPLATGVANAGPGDNATTITLSPSTATDTVGNCTPYKVTTNPNATFDVQISEQSASATTIDFCDVSDFAQFQGPNDNAYTYADNAQAGCNTATAATTPPATPNTAQCDAQFTANAQGIVEFGVTSDTPGTMKVVAYNDQNANWQFSNNETPNSQATETWVANQAGGTNSVSCEPADQTQEINTTASWNCTVTTAQGSGVNSNNLNVYFNVNSGPDAAAYAGDNQCDPDNSTSTGSAGGFNGVYNCHIDNQGGIGNDAITNFVDNNGNSNFDPGEPSDNNNVHWVSPAANNAVVQLDCSPNEEVADTVPENGPFYPDGSYCQVTPDQPTAEFTATVSAGGAPQTGVVVNFYEYNSSINNGSYTLSNNGQCVTNASGTCSVTLTQTGFEDGDWVELRAYDTNHTSDISEVDWIAPTSDDARNITVEPSDANQETGGSQTFTATVVNRFDEPVKGTCIGWTETGPGRVNNPSNLNCAPNFPDDSYDTTCQTNTQGQCSIEVSSNTTESGDETVTATIDTANYNDPTHGVECTAPAGRTYSEGGTDTSTPPGDESDGADAGNCSDAGTVTWGAAPPSGKHAIGLHLACFSHHKGKIKCVAQTGPATQGVTVKFFNKKGHKVATDVTNKAGKAHFIKTGKKSGKTYVFQAHANHTATTYSADSKRAKVTVQ